MTLILLNIESKNNSIIDIRLLSVSDTCDIKRGKQTLKWKLDVDYVCQTMRGLWSKWSNDSLFKHFLSKPGCNENNLSVQSIVHLSGYRHCGPTKHAFIIYHSTVLNERNRNGTISLIGVYSVQCLIRASMIYWYSYKYWMTFWDYWSSNAFLYFKNWWIIYSTLQESFALHTAAYMIIMCFHRE